ncbi:MAG: response regulator [Chlorobiaceae bacterium]|nr:response regulator [Chlorobiaceae bacterium]MBA4309431.1 response regulator [Chlorobiaceae bacterium]
MKIMVVDDEKDIKLLFEQRFKKEIKSGQVSFLFAFSGEEACDYIKSNGVVDIKRILSDINMPGMNGLELLKWIKENYPELKVAMITAYGDQNNYNQAIEYGCDDYMTKPIDFNQLKGKVLQ